MTKILAVILIAGPSLTAQEMENYIFKLDNGAHVLYQTYSELSLSNKERAFGTAAASGNAIRRTMLDEKRNQWMAFELHIDRKPGPGPIHFLLSMEPLGTWRFFGQKAAPREVENGDRILLDVLEEPGTGRKVFDTFQVGIGVPMQIMPMSRSIPEIPKAATAIHVENPRLTKIGRRGGAPAGNRGSIFGAKVAVTVPDKGRFIFSSQPEPGFRMEAIADGSRLSFVVGSDLYDLRCAAPVIAPGRASYLWVKRDGPEDRITVPNLDLVEQ